MWYWQSIIFLRYVISIWNSTQKLDNPNLPNAKIAAAGTPFLPNSARRGLRSWYDLSRFKVSCKIDSLNFIETW